MDNTAVPDISVCMVSLNCWGVLKHCLETLPASLEPLRYEIILVDNASTDDTVRQVTQIGDGCIRIVRNDRNTGFTRANNQAIRLASGKYILWLNTDTVLNPKSLFRLHAFMEANPKVGIAGPKVLNPDGSFQAQCRRGMPTPSAALAHFTKLDAINFGRRRFGEYLKTYLPVDEAAPVEAVSGCCLMARREVWDTVGPLDDAIFGFGEDIDWCVRAKNAGWEVWYYPGSVITHLKGQGGVHVKPYHKVFGIHQAMWIFYRKHLKPKQSRAAAAAVGAGIGLSLAASLCGTFVRRIIGFLHH